MRTNVIIPTAAKKNRQHLLARDRPDDRNTFEQGGRREETRDGKMEMTDESDITIGEKIREDGKSG